MLKAPPASKSGGFVFKRKRNMKKTLIAIAAVAATGGAFAQVTVSGTLGMALQKNSALTSTSGSQGLQMVDGHINFAASEDLGGGYKATASSEVRLRGRETGVAARDATLTLQMPAATLTMGAYELGSTLTNAWSGAPASFADGPDGTVIDGYYTVDGVGLSLPLGAGTFGWSHIEVNDPLQSGNSAGNQSTVRGERLTYNVAAGALSMDLVYTMYSSNKVAQPLWDDLTKMELAFSYDFGAVKAGLGMQAANHDVAAQYAAGFNVPMGALNFGMTYSHRAEQKVNAGYGLVAEDARSGTTIGMSYALSKQTTFSAQYATYTGMGANNVPATGTKADNEYRIKLQKSF